MELLALEIEKLLKKHKGVKFGGFVIDEEENQTLILGDQKFRAAIESALPSIKKTK